MMTVPSQSAERTLRSQRRYRTRLGRWTRRAVPVLAWLGAIAAAVEIYHHGGSGSQVIGYAEDAFVSVAHLELGTVRSVHIKLHDTVMPGQLIVLMDDDLERAQLATVEADVERLRAEAAAQAERLQLENTIATADADDLVRRAELDRDVAYIDYLSQMVINASDQVLLRGLRVDYEIVRDLQSTNDATFRELNDIETQVNALEITLKENQGVLKTREKAYIEADRRCQVARQHIVAPLNNDSVLAPYRIAIQVRQREFQEIVTRIDSHVLRAPCAGQVVALTAHAGDSVLAGEPLVVISALTTPRILAYLPENMIHLAPPGRNVTVERLADGALQPLLRGTTVSLSAAVTQTPPRYRPNPDVPAWGRGVVIALSDPESVLIPGEAVAIRFRR